MMKSAVIEAIERGVKAQRAGRLREASRIYQRILTTKPSANDAGHRPEIIAMVYNNLGFAQQQLGDVDSALENFRKATETNVNYDAAHNNLGFAQQQSNDLESAIASYRRAIAINPENTEAHYNLGNALQYRGDLEEAFACFETVLELAPNNVDVHNALGAAYQQAGRLDESIAAYQKAIAIDPSFAEAYNNLALVLQTKGELDASIDYCRKALEIKPDYANALSTLGHALYDKGDLEGAIESYRQALKVTPDSIDAYNNLGNALQMAGEYDEALQCFDALSSPDCTDQVEIDPNKHLFWFNARSRALECLFTLKRYEELKTRLKALAEAGDMNRRVAAVSAYASHQLDLENRHPFCTTPLDFFHVSSLAQHHQDPEALIEGLLAEGEKTSLVWEPQHGVTRSGYQSANRIFDAGAGPFCTELEQILRQEIETYVQKYQAERCGYMNFWPEDYHLKGWFARLMQQGHQISHIHPAGWLSGVVYLKTVEPEGADEGALELSLHGYDLPILNADYPRIVHQPRRGEIVLFPSSLFHRTIPFNEDTDRIVIAFDLHPNSDVQEKPA